MTPGIRKFISASLLLDASSNVSEFHLAFIHSGPEFGGHIAMAPQSVSKIHAEAADGIAASFF
jgi:hypothetical protein